MNKLCLLIISACILLFVCGCSTTYLKLGSYQVAEEKDGLGGLLCQPHSEFYFVDPASGKKTFLGACGTPRFITTHFGMPSEPSCFAIAEDGTSIVYFHIPEQCGAGTKATRKAGGVYVHSVESGDKLIYGEKLVNRTWSSRETPPDAIRVSWISMTPSAKGAICGQDLVLNSKGKEIIEGRPLKKCIWE